MEKNLTATFHNVDNLEQAAEQLRKQGIIDMKFPNLSAALIDYQSDMMIQSIESSALAPSYELEVCVQQSRYREAEDTILKFGGDLHELRSF
ncbi:hypothetical protein [Paenibacillus aestuarii]|uniref:Uncharacterized protein n=1 Tax=Paenibacillus aestuarii TaxID=516965 RepID=A0ABW0KDN5_9BACL|nr:hypothetical protein [Paenibacillus aestuarii]